MPFPEIITVWNAIITEYCHVKQITGSPKFPELDLDKYRRLLAFGVDQIKEPQTQEQMRVLLSARGWKTGETPVPLEPPLPGVEAFSPNAIEFQSWDDALNHALTSPRERAFASNHETLIAGVAVPFTEGWDSERQKE